MVQKSRGGRKCRSVVSGKKRRSEMKHLRKENYKKKVEKKIECCVCYEEVPDRSDNVIMCGKSKHVLCSSCKLKMLGTGSECPMCRSHPIPEPKSRDVNIRIFKKNENEEKNKKKIMIEGVLSVRYINGVYEEIGKDKDKLSIYRSVKTYGKRGVKLYIYRSSNMKYSDWVLNDRYAPNDRLIHGWSSGKLKGTSEWMISINDGGEWGNETLTITGMN